MYRHFTRGRHHLKPRDFWHVGKHGFAPATQLQGVQVLFFIVTVIPFCLVSAIFFFCLIVPDCGVLLLV